MTGRSENWPNRREICVRLFGSYYTHAHVSLARSFVVQQKIANIYIYIYIYIYMVFKISYKMKFCLKYIVYCYFVKMLYDQLI